MTTPEKAFTLAWFPKISVLVAVALGVLFTEPPLATDRVNGGSDSDGVSGPVRLRYLWEDPLQGIPENPNFNEHLRLAEALKDVGHVLFVAVEGGDRPTFIENRIRTRIAVTSAICGQMNFIPVLPDDETATLAYDGKPYKPDQLSRRRITVNGTDQLVVVECFNPTVPMGQKSQGGGKRGIAVVYLDELRLQPKIQNLRWLIHSASARPPFSIFPESFETNLKNDSTKIFSYIGPVRSSSLKMMVESADPPDDPAGKFKDTKPVTMDVYSGSASIDLKNLSSYDPSSPEKNLKELKSGDQFTINLKRIGAHDGLVTAALADELKLRGVNPTGIEPSRLRGESGARDAVLILSDMDQLHTSGLVRSFTEKWLGDGESDLGHKLVRVIRYPEALDSLKAGPEKSDSGKDPDPSVYSSGIHAAEGLSQYDAVRRLPERLREMEKADNVRYRAFGFFGSDPHDKILLMRALKNSFSEAAFFTNDIDALYWQGKDRGCTQNLITASSFGLSLGTDLQGGVPPFRSSVQTGIYLACLEACRDGKKTQYGGDSVVEIHEIGRKGADLQGYSENNVWKGTIKGRSSVRGPWRIERYAQIAIIVGILTGLAVAFYVGRPRHWQLTELLKPWENPPSDAWKIAIPLVAAVVILSGVLCWLSKEPSIPRGDIEPRAWLLGVSSLPVIIGSIVAVLSGVVMVVTAWWRSQENLSEVSKTYPFGGEPDEREPVEDKPTLPIKKLKPLWLDVIGWFARLTSKRDGKWSFKQRISRLYGIPATKPLLNSLTPIQAMFARDALASGALNRALRVTFAFIVIIMFWVLTEAPGNDFVPPFVRGKEMQIVYKVTDLAAKVVLVGSCLFAVDAQFRNGLANLRLRRILQRSDILDSSPYPCVGRNDLPSKYFVEKQPGVQLPSNSLRPLGKIPSRQKPLKEVRQRDVGLWELPLVKALALRFEASAPVVTIPFTVLFCLVVSRFQVFEGVTYPAAEILLYLVFLAAPLAAGAFAQYQMAGVFDAAENRIRQGVAVHTGDLEKFCKMETEFLTTLEGRTTYSFLSNPLLKAVMLPLGSVGVLELITTVAPYLK